MNGIDVYEGNDLEDFNLLKNQGVEVIIAKATQGVDYTDHSFAYRCSHVRQVGIKFGAYHFAGGLHSAESEAQHFLDVIKGQTFDTAVFLDIENYGSKTWGKQEAINFCNAWFNYIKERGYKVGIYTNESLYNDFLKGNIPEDVVLWLANYSRKPTVNCSWQYSESGKLNGAEGNLDFDNFQNDIYVNSGNVSRQSQPQKVALPSNFSESYYLQCNPDVAAAVQSGKFKNGIDHYEQYGYKENRKFAPAENISYAAYVQNKGMMDFVTFNQQAGTVGQGLRMEGLTINYTGKGKLTFQGHVQNIGWQGLRDNGEYAGTMGQSLRLEAVKINLEGSDMKLSYSAHVQNIGWQPYVNAGEIAGTVGKGLRIEAIKIKLI